MTTTSLALATAAGPRASTAPAATDAFTAAAKADPDRITRKLERIYGVRSTSKGLLFIQPADSARTLAIAADFNNWNPSRTPMRRDEQLGVWQTCVDVQLACDRPK